MFKHPTKVLIGDCYEYVCFSETGIGARLCRFVSVRLYRIQAERDGNAYGLFRSGFKKTDGKNQRTV